MNNTTKSGPLASLMTSTCEHIATAATPATVQPVAAAPCTLLCDMLRQPAVCRTARQVAALAVEGKAPSVRQLQSQGLRLSADIVAAFEMLQEQCGVKNSMPREQLRIMLRDLFDEMPWLTLHDMAVVMLRVRTGAYGELYERISEPKVFVWFRQYAAERLQATAWLLQRRQADECGGEEWVRQWYARLMRQAASRQ